MSIPDIDDDMVARAMRSLGLADAGKAHPHGPCRYEAVHGDGWHVMRVRGSGFQERRALVRIVPTKDDAMAMIRQLEKADAKGQTS